VNRFLVAGAVVAASLAVSVPGAAAGGRDNTEVDFDGAAEGDQTNANTRFFGSVDSTSRCTRDRKIVIVGDNAGKIGTTRTDSRGYWSIEFPDANFVEGVYTATAKKTTKCKEGAASRAFL